MNEQAKYPVMDSEFLTPLQEKRQYLLTEISAIVEENRNDKLPQKPTDKLFTLFSHQLGRMDDWVLDELLATLQLFQEQHHFQPKTGAKT